MSSVFFLSAAVLEPFLPYSQSDAVKYLKKYNYRIDAALDGLFNDPSAVAALTAAREPIGAQTTKLGDLFDKYKGMYRLLVRHYNSNVVVSSR